MAGNDSLVGLHEFIPISPILTKSGALVQLVGLVGEDLAKPVPLQDPASALTNFTVNAGSLSISLAASLGISAIFKGTIGANEKAFSLDAMTYTDQYQEKALPDGGVYATRWGIGLRIFLRVQDLSANASLNFATVGAAIELKQATAQYEISGVGIGIAGLLAVLKNIPAVGDFNYETYLKINNEIVKSIAQYIADHEATLRPQPVAVALAKPIDPISSARTYYYAMRKIANRDSLRDALSGAPGALDRNSIRATYTAIAQVQKDDDEPSRDAQRRADDWLSVG